MTKQLLILVGVLFLASCAATGETTDDVKVAQEDKKEPKTSKNCDRKITGSRFKRC